MEFGYLPVRLPTHDSLAMRYVAANQHPDHDTICTFRRRFLQPLSTLFVQILEIVHQMDLVEVGDVSINGSKVNANASEHKAMSWERACQLDHQLAEEVDELMVRAEQTDSEQVEKEALPEEISRRTDRLANIRQAKAMIDERAVQRYEAEKAEYMQKMADRVAKEKRTGNKTPGRKPKPPEPGPREGVQVNFTDP